jgi:HPt (histidine-containing phosphotransfer) domain-containing protein
VAGERTLDRAALERLKDWGGPELRDQMIALFLENTPVRVQNVLDGLGAGDRELAHRAAHSLKSTSSNVGAEALGAIAGRIEVLLATGEGTGAGEGPISDEAAARALLPELESALRDALTALGAVRRSDES